MNLPGASNRTIGARLGSAIEQNQTCISAASSILEPIEQNRTKPNQSDAIFYSCDAGN